MEHLKKIDMFSIVIGVVSFGILLAFSKFYLEKEFSAMTIGVSLLIAVLIVFAYTKFKGGSSDILTDSF